MSEILRNLKSEGVSIMIAESNLQHCLDLLDCMFVIERGSVEERSLEDAVKE
jgi:ABC-type lipopolysaccharide export system ATPase subunit